MKDDVSLWIAIVITIFLVLGSGLTLIGAIGLMRFSCFYERLHMPSLGASLGTGSIVIAAILYAIFVDGHFVVHEALLAIFTLITIPVTTMLLSQAAAHRDHSEDWLQKPPTFLVNQTEEKLPTLEDKTSH
ncbi:monovalent cation/H(+) antiporter subunit G [Bartonella melophagi]|uniref:Monovalent cation/proton antiporter, MnhG/PhaG subunit n=1 Tax=Bartonella melophagi K-2C TaxID=1094557 RepID=J0R0P7_9HYPH|nr:monovalent cation/H(+) antiporter subunit G [Bartonella melophagi]EJF92011.1 monovalent cation/proton antiporter, MnhG/PhaG subunit [Bartonella melophagi K-2C]